MSDYIDEIITRSENASKQLRDDVLSLPMQREKDIVALFPIMVKLLEDVHDEVFSINQPLARRINATLKDAEKLL